MLAYRRCAGCVIFNRAGLVLVGERIGYPGAFQLPQGGIDGEETLREAALREAYEEVGIPGSGLIHVADLPGPYAYDFPPNTGGALAKLFRGQELGFSLFFADTERPAAEICNLQGLGGEPPEFSSVKWAPLQEIPRGIVEFKRGVYESLVPDAQPLITNFLAMKDGK
jgi:putative (di)nucleoside polyphosphate hydrolase